MDWSASLIPYQSVTLIPYQSVTLIPYQSVTLIPYQSVTLIPSHHISLIPMICCMHTLIPKQLMKVIRLFLIPMVLILMHIKIPISTVMLILYIISSESI